MKIFGIKLTVKSGLEIFFEIPQGPSDIPDNLQVQGQFSLSGQQIL
jgi:hypothetical protein